ncbi:MAG: PD40 domain-containing protein, partial [Muribaculaceae bacterium]|nr:PD40 domain-containing protein [Muribaculaceae bacterium]
MKKITAIVALAAMSLTVSATTPLWLRQAKISPNGKEIAFSYKGDIWKVAATGGTAVRLTSQDSYESYPQWSPDGTQIAFASDRKGNFDVYVMPSQGGSAKRLTTNSAGEVPAGFSADGKYVYFGAVIQDPAESALFPTSALGELYKVSVEGGRTVQVLATPA